jgi:hypothetical protein
VSVGIIAYTVYVAQQERKRQREIRAAVQAERATRLG